MIAEFQIKNLIGTKRKRKVSLNYEPSTQFYSNEINIEKQEKNRQKEEEY